MMPQENNRLGKISQEALVSVIVPVYRVEQYLSTCLDSILDQTYPNLQIILVDDGSPDRCGEICEEYRRRDARVQVIHKENGGVSSARNVGLQAAEGEWIAWVDSDDWISQDMVEYLLDGALQNRADAAVCGRYEVHPKKMYAHGPETAGVLTPEQALRKLLDVNDREIENYLWDKLWRRSLFEGIRFPEGKTFEDFAVVFRLFERCERIACLPEAKYFYLQRSGDIMRDASLANHLNRYEAAKTRYDGMIGAWPQFEDMLVSRCVRMAVNVWIACGRAPRSQREQERLRLEAVSAFLGPYIQKGFRPEILGAAGQAIVRLLPYPRGWSFAAARTIYWLYRVRQGSLRQGWRRAGEKLRQTWVVSYNSAKHFWQNGWARRNARYIHACRTLPIQENLVLYEAYWGRGAMCSPYGMFEYLLHDPAYAGLEHVWVLDNPGAYQNTVEKYRDCPNVRFVEYMQRDYLKAMSQAKYLFCNTALPRFFIKREGQVYVNTWHGIPLKQIGPDAPGGLLDSGNAIRSFLQTDYLISANPFLTEIYKTTYSMQGLYGGKILEEGYPRLDILVRRSGEEYADALRQLGVEIDPGREILLYAPTWRELRNSKSHIAAVMEEYRQVKARLEAALPEYQVLVKVHQFVYEHLKGSSYPKYIIPATVDANEVLPIADVLLVDYSSIYFDYLYFERPILFYIPDIELYAKSRGLYRPIGTLPGPASRDLDQVIDWLRHLDGVERQYREKRLEAKKWSCAVNAGGISRRAAEVIFQNRREGYALTEVSDDRKKVLLQTGSLTSEALVYLLLDLQARLDYSRYDVTLAIPEPGDWQSRELVDRFDRRLRVMVQNRAVNVTPSDDRKLRLIRTYGFSGWRKARLPVQVFREETRRRYGDCRFDHAVHLGDKDFTDLMVVALLRGESPDSPDFDPQEQNRRAVQRLLSELGLNQ